MLPDVTMLINVSYSFFFDFPPASYACFALCSSLIRHESLSYNKDVVFIFRDGSFNHLLQFSLAPTTPSGVPLARPHEHMLYNAAEFDRLKTCSQSFLRL